MTTGSPQHPDGFEPVDPMLAEMSLDASTADQERTEAETMAQDAGEPVPPPSPDEQLAIQEKLKALRASVQGMQTAAEHEQDLAKHFEIVSRVEHNLPGLVDFAFKICSSVGQFCREKGIDSKRTALGNIFWTPGGEVAFEVLYDPYDLTPKDQPAFLKRGYARLPEMAKEYPPVFELVMTLAHHLAGEVGARGRENLKRELQFIELRHFKSPRTNTDMWAFKMLDKKAIKRATRRSM